MNFNKKMNSFKNLNSEVEEIRFAVLNSELFYQVSINDLDLFSIAFAFPSRLPYFKYIFEICENRKKIGIAMSTSSGGSNPDEYYVCAKIGKSLLEVFKYQQDECAIFFCDTKTIGGLFRTENSIFLKIFNQNFAKIIIPNFRGSYLNVDCHNYGHFKLNIQRRHSFLDFSRALISFFSLGIYRPPQRNLDSILPDNNVTQMMKKKDLIPLFILSIVLRLIFIQADFGDYGGD